MAFDFERLLSQLRKLQTQILENDHAFDTLNDDEVVVNGISTSLRKEARKEFVALSTALISIVQRRLNNTIDESDAVYLLRTLLSAHWFLTKNSPLNYTSQPFLPNNLLGRLVANIIVPEDEAICSLLMPTVTKVIGPADVNTSLMDATETREKGLRNFQPELFCLGYDDTLLSILEIFEYATNSPARLFSDDSPFELDEAEREILRYSCGAHSRVYYDALDELYLNQQDENSFGKQLEMLANDLLAGSISDRGMAADKQADSNLTFQAIRRFYDVWMKIPREDLQTQEVSRDKDTVISLTRVSLSKLRTKHYGENAPLIFHLLVLFNSCAEYTPITIGQKKYIELELKRSREIIDCTNQIGNTLLELLSEYPELYCLKLNGQSSENMAAVNYSESHKELETALMDPQRPPHPLHHNGKFISNNNAVCQLYQTISNETFLTQNVEDKLNAIINDGCTIVILEFILFHRWDNWEISANKLYKKLAKANTIVKKILSNRDTFLSILDQWDSRYYQYLIRALSLRFIQEKLIYNHKNLLMLFKVVPNNKHHTMWRLLGESLLKNAIKTFENAFELLAMLSGPAQFALIRLVAYHFLPNVSSLGCFIKQFNPDSWAAVFQVLGNIFIKKLIPDFLSLCALFSHVTEGQYPVLRQALTHDTIIEILNGVGIRDFADELLIKHPTDTYKRILEICGPKVLIKIIPGAKEFAFLLERLNQQQQLAFTSNLPEDYIRHLASFANNIYFYSVYATLIKENKLLFLNRCAAVLNYSSAARTTLNQEDITTRIDDFIKMETAIANKTRCKGTFVDNENSAEFAISDRQQRTATTSVITRRAFSPRNFPQLHPSSPLINEKSTSSDAGPSENQTWQFRRPAQTHQIPVRTRSISFA